jgi:hypothetical protein
MAVKKHGLQLVIGKNWGEMDERMKKGDDFFGAFHKILGKL